MAAYDWLADRFEYLNDDCDYLTWSQYLLWKLQSLGAGNKGLEIGCGSGYFSRFLTKNGYTMSAMDCSEPMLTKAYELAEKEQVFIRFFRADAKNFRTTEKFGFVLSVNDCYNYLPSDALPAAFRHAAAALPKGGLFLFDVSSPCKFREKIADNMFADDRDDVTYLAFSKLFEDRVELQVSLFLREADGRYLRRDETHIQYIHEYKTIEEALRGAGFDLVGWEGAFGEKPEGSDRWNFQCRKA